MYHWKKADVVLHIPTQPTILMHQLSSCSVESSHRACGCFIGLHNWACGRRETHRVWVFITVTIHTPDQAQVSGNLYCTMRQKDWPLIMADQIWLIATSLELKLQTEGTQTTIQLEHSSTVCWSHCNAIHTLVFSGDIFYLLPPFGLQNREGTYR